MPTLLKSLGRSGVFLVEEAAGVEGALITEGGDLRATEGMLRCSDLPGSFYAAHPDV